MPSNDSEAASAETAFRFNLGIDWMNDHADIALAWPLIASNHPSPYSPPKLTTLIYTRIQPTGPRVNYAFVEDPSGKARLKCLCWIFRGYHVQTRLP